MGYSLVALEDKILEMYPEIRSLSPRITFDEQKDAWIVKLRKGSKEAEICLDKEDADACVNFNTYCKSFGDAIAKTLKQL
ncbi:MAG: hypothetical protein AB1390_10865 [Nitrospirota bacterium]